MFLDYWPLRYVVTTYTVGVLPHFPVSPYPMFFSVSLVVVFIVVIIISIIVVVAF